MKLSRWPNSENRIDADQRAGQASDAKRIAPFPSRSTRMRKALRGYAQDKNGNLILIGTMPVPFSKDKCATAVRQQKDIWLGKVQRSLGKKRFVTRPVDPTSAESRRRIGRCDNSSDAREPLVVDWSRAAMPTGRKTRLHPAAPSPRCARETPRCPRSSNPSN